MNEEEASWRNGDVRPARAVRVRADELRIGDHIAEGVKVVALHTTNPPEGDGRIDVTTDNPKATHIAWPRDHEVMVVRGSYWRPGLGLGGEHT